MLTISQLWIYPIKSCQGIQVNQIELLSSGFKDDRCMMIVDEKGRFITQRSDAILAQLEVTLEQDNVTLRHQDNHLSFTRQYHQKAHANVWKREVPAFDQGEPVARFLTQFLGKKVRLLATRPSDTANSDNPVLFQDKQAIHLISEASLQHAQLHIPDFVIDVRRFRPNIVVADSQNSLPAFAEDQWQTIQTDMCRIDFYETCERCNIPSINPDTLSVESAVADYLRLHRRFSGRTIFGVSGGSKQTGILHVNDVLHSFAKQLI